MGNILRLDDILRNTAVIRREVPLLEAVHWLCYDKDLQDLVVVGCMAGKLLINPQYKGQLLWATDIDVAMKKIPENVKKGLVERRLIESASRTYRIMGYEPVEEEVRESNHKVYGFSEKGIVDIFEGDVGGLVIPDSLKPVVFNLGLSYVKDETERVASIQVAHPGFLFASCLLASTRKRLARGWYLLKTAGQENYWSLDRDGTIAGCLTTLQESGIKQVDLKPALNAVRNNYRRRDPSYFEVVNSIYNKIN